VRTDGTMLNVRPIWSLDHGRPIATPACSCVSGRHVGRLFFVVALSFTAMVVVDASRDLSAEAPKATFAGLGATSCQRFNEDIRSNPLLRRDYLAWAQGFMSGILSSRPPGVDQGLDLAPVTFDVKRQLQFLEDYCARNVSLDFSDAVGALYKRLREEGKT
jgi:hypothetical protein